MDLFKHKNLISGFDAAQKRSFLMPGFPMHRVCLSALLSGLLMAASLGCAQTATTVTIMLDLPRQSQHAVVTQRIGITDITINYHRPLVNGRQILGKVVPYDQVWRAG